jgi:hypothetical protein
MRGLEQGCRGALRSHGLRPPTGMAGDRGRCRARTIVVMVAVVAVLFICPALEANSAVHEGSSSDISGQAVLKHASPQVKSVATLALALITALVALLALIVDKEGVNRFYDTYPYVSWRRRAAWLGKAVNSVFWLFSARKCIVYVLVFSIASTIICFLGHFRPEEASVLQILHRVVEGAMFLAIGFFMVILVRIFNFCLTYKPISRIAGRGGRKERER